MPTLALPLSTHLPCQEHFEELVEFMSSGPCLTLVLTRGDTGEGVLEGMRELLGPADVEKAREEAPERWARKSRVRVLLCASCMF